MNGMPTMAEEILRGQSIYLLYTILTAIKISNIHSAYYLKFHAKPAIVDESPETLPTS